MAAVNGCQYQCACGSWYSENLYLGHMSQCPRVLPTIAAWAKCMQGKRDWKVRVGLHLAWKVRTREAVN